jgi:hypothetical protein
MNKQEKELYRLDFCCYTKWTPQKIEAKSLTWHQRIFTGEKLLPFTRKWINKKKNFTDYTSTVIQSELHKKLEANSLTRHQQLFLLYWTSSSDELNSPGNDKNELVVIHRP